MEISGLLLVFSDEEIINIRHIDRQSLSYRSINIFHMNKILHLENETVQIKKENSVISKLCIVVLNDLTDQFMEMVDWNPMFVEYLGVYSIIEIVNEGYNWKYIE